MTPQLKRNLGLAALTLSLSACCGDECKVSPTAPPPVKPDTVIVRTSVPSLTECMLPLTALQGDLIPGRASGTATEGKIPDVTISYDGTPINGKGTVSSQFIAKGSNYSCAASIDGVVARADKGINVTPLSANIAASPQSFQVGGNSIVTLSGPAGMDSLQLYKNGSAAKDAAGNPLKALPGSNGQLVYTRATPGVDTLSVKGFNNKESVIGNNVIVTATAIPPPPVTTGTVVIQPVSYSAVDTLKLDRIVGTVIIRNKLTGAVYQQTNTAADRPVVFRNIPGGTYEGLLSSAAPSAGAMAPGIQTHWDFSKLNQKPADDGVSTRRPYSLGFMVPNGDSLSGQWRFFPVVGQRGQLTYRYNELHSKSTSLDDDFSGIEGVTPEVVLLDCLIPGGTVNPGYTEFPNRASADSADAIIKREAAANGILYRRIQTSNPQFVRGSKVFGYRAVPADVRSIWTRKTDPSDRTVNSFTMDQAGMYLYNPIANNATENNSMRAAVQKFLAYGQTNDSRVFGDQALRPAVAEDRTFVAGREFFAPMLKGVKANPLTWRGVVSFNTNLSPVGSRYDCSTGICR